MGRVKNSTKFLAFTTGAVFSLVAILYAPRLLLRWEAVIGGMSPLVLAGRALWLAVWALVPVYAVRRLLLGIRSNQWPTVEGTIVNSKTVTTESGYRPAVKYEYAVYGRQFSGTMVTFARFGNMSSRRRADAIVSRYPTGSQVSVYYNPRHPKFAVLEPGVSHENYLVLFSGLLIVTLIILSF